MRDRSRESDVPADFYPAGGGCEQGRGGLRNFFLFIAVFNVKPALEKAFTPGIPIYKFLGVRVAGQTQQSEATLMNLYHIRRPNRKLELQGTLTVISDDGFRSIHQIIRRIQILFPCNRIRIRLL